MRNNKAIKYYEEGRLRQFQGELSAAERAYRKAIKADQDFVEAYNNLGNVLVDRERLQEAAGAYRKAIKILPNHPMLLNNLGHALQLQGETDKAIGWFEKAIAQDPKYADAYVNLGNALRFTDRPERALEYYRQATTIDPGHAEAFTNMGILLMELKDPEAAVASLERAVAIMPCDTRAHFELGNALKDQGQTSRAIDSLHKLLELDPENSNAYARLGDFYMELGQWQESSENYRRAIALQPDNGAAFLGLSLIKNLDLDEELLDAMEQQHRNPDISPKNLSHISFALGNTHAKSKHYDKAFEKFKQANQLKWSLEQYDVEREIAYFQKLKKAFNPGVFDQASTAGSTDVTPVFIVGLPSSGKTLAETMLANHPQVCAAGERHCLRNTLLDLGDLQNPDAMVKKILDLSEDKIGRYAKAYFDEIQQFCAGDPFVVDTMPINFYYVGFINLLFPQAKIIHCCRQPMDACWFLYQRSFRSSAYNYSNDLDALAAYYKGYRDLIEHWHSVLPGFIYDLHYEQLIPDTEHELSRLLSYVGLERDGDCLDHYENAPLHQGEIGYWRNYQEYLGPLRTALE
jgi:tetratricopeptide (TPR) repeat protein